MNIGKRALIELWPASVSIIAAITANQEAIEWGLRCAALAVSIVAGLLGIIRFFRPASRQGLSPASVQPPSE